jgi:O-methyltransferase
MLKSAFQSAFNALGYRVVKLPNAAPYGRVLPEADYMPWNSDEAFLETYSAVRSHTLVDTYRCWELWTLVQQTAKLSGGAIVEVGVWRGGTAAILARAAQRAGVSEQLYLCDTFAGVVKSGPNDSFYRGGEHADTTRDLVEGLLRSLHLTNARTVAGIFPDESAGSLPADLRLRLVHLDVDTYQSGHDAMAWAWPRLVSGGIVVYDDYGFHSCTGITTLVNEQASWADALVLHNLNGHALVIKR